MIIHFWKPFRAHNLFKFNLTLPFIPNRNEKPAVDTSQFIPKFKVVFEMLILLSIISIWVLILPGKNLH